MSSFGKGIQFTNVSSAASVTEISKQPNAANSTAARMEGHLLGQHERQSANPPFKSTLSRHTQRTDGSKVRRDHCASPIYVQVCAVMDPCKIFPRAGLTATSRLVLEDISSRMTRVVVFFASHKSEEALKR